MPDHEPATEPDELVIVETDKSHANYDARLAALLAMVERERSSGQRLPFPRTHQIPAAVLAQEYQVVHVEPSDDASWHFAVQLPRSTRIEVSRSTSTARIRPPTTLATFRLAQPETSIDVIGLKLTASVDVASWLDEWLEQLGMTPVSSRPRHTEHGVMGDIIATSRSDHGMQVARYATERFDERTFVIVLRAPLASYPLVARDFVLAVSSLCPMVPPATVPPPAVQPD